MLIKVLILASFWYVISIKNQKLLNKLGAQVLKLRKEKKLSQEQLAHKAQIPVNQVGRIERGEVNPTVSTLYAISIALDIELHDMLKFNFG